jgi:hypothetical protein
MSPVKLSVPSPTMKPSTPPNDHWAATEIPRNSGHPLLEVLGLDVGGSGLLVAEGLDQDVLRGVFNTSRPFEPQAACLGAGRLGDFTDDLSPSIRVLGPNSELRGDEDHDFSFLSVGVDHP